MKLAVIGCGRWGKNILRTLEDLQSSESFRLNEVVHTGNPQRAEWVRKTVGVDCHTNLERSLESNDAVCITTPDETHPHLVNQALEAELDVFVEKPVAFELEDARELFDRAAENNSLLMPGHLMVFHPVLSWLEETEGFEPHTIDEIMVTRLNNLRDSGERRLLHSSLIHDLSLLDHFFGSGPEDSNVHETMGPFPPGRYLSAQLDYQGTTVRVRARTDWPFRERSIVLRNDERYFAFDGLEETVKIVDRSEDSGQPEKKSFETLPLTEELKHFVRAARGDEECRITREHVLRVMKTMRNLQEEAIERLDSRSGSLPDG